MTPKVAPTHLELAVLSFSCAFGMSASEICILLLTLLDMHGSNISHAGLKQWAWLEKGHVWVKVWVWVAAFYFWHYFMYLSYYNFQALHCSKIQVWTRSSRVLLLNFSEERCILFPFWVLYFYTLSPNT